MYRFWALIRLVKLPSHIPCLVRSALSRSANLAAVARSFCSLLAIFSPWLFQPFKGSA
jgi:hypothetical protein